MEYPLLGIHDCMYNNKQGAEEYHIKCRMLAWSTIKANHQDAPCTYLSRGMQLQMANKSDIGKKFMVLFMVVLILGGRIMVEASRSDCKTDADCNGCCDADNCGYCCDDNPPVPCCDWAYKSFSLPIYIVE